MMAAAMAEQEGSKGSARNRGGVQRVEGKLRASVEKGDYYEAHQMYRTLFFRYGKGRGLCVFQESSSDYNVPELSKALS